MMQPPLHRPFLKRRSHGISLRRSPTTREVMTAMDIRLPRLFHGILLCGLAAMLPAASQSPQRPQGPQARPAPSTGRPQPGNRPNPGNRPGVRPNPGTRPVNRPNPGQPGNPPRPQPSKPGVKPIPRPPSNRPPSHRPPGNRPVHGRPPQWGRPPASRPSYGFRPADRNWLRHRYAARLRYINRARRPIFTIGGYIPYADIGYLSSLPPDVYGYLPPPPPGYQMGYWNGYVVVYDPVTYFITNLVDLLQ